jgi:hypothetical protein
LSSERRATRFEHVLLVFNESDTDVSERLRFNLASKRVRVFDPERSAAVSDAPLAGDRILELQVPARRWRILVLPN